MLWVGYVRQCAVENFRHDLKWLGKSGAAGMILARSRSHFTTRMPWNAVLQRERPMPVAYRSYELNVG
jgi:hypothetical protein